MLYVEEDLNPPPSDGTGEPELLRLGDRMGLHWCWELLVHPATPAHKDYRSVGAWIQALTN